MFGSAMLDQRLSFGFRCGLREVRNSAQEVAGRVIVADRGEQAVAVRQAFDRARGGHRQGRAEQLQESQFVGFEDERIDALDDRRLGQDDAEHVRVDVRSPGPGRRIGPIRLFRARARDRTVCVSSRPSCPGDRYGRSPAGLTRVCGTLR
ncbi:hypothetical protein Snoj_17910 [Streptomyces nojiriensis]|uniref:Uncharacterized protein n=1 Tax=Streptomyces nojiriensis TaxID=66374 RepID=A0ABQ3SI97_9ACTN|nr:hypothetical protein GCM10010205_76540 [Streptomyces nojiriensis]GHI67873.1 hypothetical protein Snoj_17910 [Streptomyces nojiriensis]